MYDRQVPLQNEMSKHAFNSSLTVPHHPIHYKHTTNQHRLRLMVKDLRKTIHFYGIMPFDVEMFLLKVPFF